MLVRLFRKSHWYTPFALLLLGVLLWLGAFLDPGRHLSLLSDHPAPLYQVLRPVLVASPLASVLGAFLLLMLQAVLVNYIASAGQLTDRFSGLTGLIYLLLMSMSPALCAPHPVLFANLFVLLAFSRALQLHEKEQGAKETFNAGLFTGLASLFYLPAMVLLLFLLVTSMILYVISLRTLAAMLLGFLLPYFVLFIWFFMGDALHDFPALFGAFPALWRLGFGYSHVAELVFFLLLALYALASISRLAGRFMPDKPIRIRKKFQVLLTLFFVVLASYLLAGEDLPVHHAMMAVPLSVSIALLFYDLGRDSRWAEFLFGLLLVGVIVMRIV